MTIVRTARIRSRPPSADAASATTRCSGVPRVHAETPTRTTRKRNARFMMDLWPHILTPESGGILVGRPFQGRRRGPERPALQRRGGVQLPEADDGVDERSRIDRLGEVEMESRLERALAIFVAREGGERSEEHTSELQSHSDLVCRLLLEKKKLA